jgi:peptidoglycan/LPS O-acetylase OafA/YrhL
MPEPQSKRMEFRKKLFTELILGCGLGLACVLFLTALGVEIPFLYAMMACVLGCLLVIAALKGWGVRRRITQRVPS